MYDLLILNTLFQLSWSNAGSTIAGTPTPTDAQFETTSSLIDHHTTDIDTQATETSTSQDILGTERQEERDSTAAAMAPILTLVGAIVGAVILLSAITVLILLMACLVRKNKKKNSKNGREMRSSEAEKINTVDIEVDTNPSYMCTTESNIAYGGVALNQVGNNLYEIMDPPIENSYSEVMVNQDGDGLYEIMDPPIDNSTTCTVSLQEIA